MGLRCVDCGSSYLYDDKEPEEVQYVVGEALHTRPLWPGEDYEVEVVDLAMFGSETEAVYFYDKLKAEFPKRNLRIDKWVKNDKSAQIAVRIK